MEFRLEVFLKKIALKSPRKFSRKNIQGGVLFIILVCYFPKIRPPPEWFLEILRTATLYEMLATNSWWR